MILSYRNYESLENIDFNSMGEINESHQYADFVASVMEKTEFYLKRNASLENSSLNESAKMAYSREIRFNRDEKIAAACIFNEMLNKYRENIDDELAVYESIISECSILEEGVEYSYDELMESIFKKLADKGKELVGKGKEIFKEIGNDIKSGTETIKLKKDELKKVATEKIKDAKEKYENIKRLISNIIKKGIDSVSAFLNYILKIFSGIGDCLKEVVKKLGCLKMEDGEEPAKISGIESDKIYKDINDEGEKSFFNNVVLRAEAMFKDKENANMVAEANEPEGNGRWLTKNKFIAWCSGYSKKTGKISPWKNLLISICAFLIILLIPLIFKALASAALVSALTIAIVNFIAAFLSTLWSGIGVLKLIYQRNMERKPGEKFFNGKTAFFFVLSLAAVGFSAVQFTKTFQPLIAEILNKLDIPNKIANGDNVSGIMKWLYERATHNDPKMVLEHTKWKYNKDSIPTGPGVDVRNHDLFKSGKDALDAMKNAGWSDAQIKAQEQLINSVQGNMHSTSITHTLMNASDPNIPQQLVIDCDKWGVPAKTVTAWLNANQEALQAHSAIASNVGSTALQTSTGGVAGSCTTIISADKNFLMDAANQIAAKAGVDAKHVLSSLIGTVSKGTWVSTTSYSIFAKQLDFIWTPVWVPFLDKKKFGKYKMRFASGTRGAAAYVVNEVKNQKISSIDIKYIDTKDNNGNKNDSKAFDELKQLHNSAWEKYAKEFKKRQESKKDGESKMALPKEPECIVFYISPKEVTGNEIDKSKGKDKETKNAIGVVIDPLTMMVADVCNFNTSAGIRRRPHPYYMKGLFSRLSFMPLKDNDNDVKDFIRTSLGTSIRTCILMNIFYGEGSNYIQICDKDEKPLESIDEKSLETAKFRTICIDSDKSRNIVEMGNLTPDEALACLKEEGKNNKAAYKLMDGKFGSSVSMKMKDGKITKISARKSSNVMENIHYYELSPREYENLKMKNNGKKPRGVTIVIINDRKTYYRRLSQKLIKSENLELKDSEKLSWAYVHIRPLIISGLTKWNTSKKEYQIVDDSLPKQLKEDDYIKKVFYKDDEINDTAFAIIEPFLYRPENTFSKDDENELAKQLENPENGDNKVERKKLNWLQNLFKSEEQLHDTVKRAIEIIWKYLSDNRRKVFSGKDNLLNHKPNDEKTTDKENKNDSTPQPDNNSYTCLFDELVEESLEDGYDDEVEYKTDLKILTERTNPIPSFSRFLDERYIKY